MQSYPPFQITPLILQKSQEISHELGLLEGARIDFPSLKLRRINYIRTIQASLAIEGNRLSKERTLSWLIKACIFHYELEFIHPFSDGNGRIGRLWQQLILMKENPLFQYLLYGLETGMLKKRGEKNQAQYSLKE